MSSARFLNNLRQVAARLPAVPSTLPWTPIWACISVWVGLQAFARTELKWG